MKKQTTKRPVGSRRSPLETIRQHHGIEHATITLLSRRLPRLQLVARSDLRGFVVYGSIDTQTLHSAADEALSRLQAGESDLAVHPNCGTNLVTAGMLSGVLALLAGSGHRRSIWDRVPSAVMGATLALLVAGPAGHWMQSNVTTTSHVSGLRVLSVDKLEGGPLERHRVAIG